MASVYKRPNSRKWQIKYIDGNGVTIQMSSGTTDKRAAEAIANKLETDAMLQQKGVISREQAVQIRSNRQRIENHLGDYLADAAERGQDPRHVLQKRRNLEGFVKAAGVAKLSEVTPERVKAYLGELQRSGLAGRTRTIRLSTIKAFMNWCHQQGRVGWNPITSAAVPKPDESPRRRRRALTPEELTRLMTVAGGRGRKAWYAAAAMAGLRRSDLIRLRWCDVDFGRHLISIVDGKRQRKAKSSGREVRSDVIPMHQELAAILASHQRETMGSPAARVFPTAVTDLTRQKDFVRAGLARWVEHVGLDGRVMRREYDATDEQGRVVDLHALRTTLATSLARAGVPLVHAQQIMRHEDARTTQRHYISVDAAETAAAIQTLRFTAS